MIITEDTIQKVVDAHNKEHYDYLERKDSPETLKLIEAIRKATDDTFVGYSASSTLLGWLPRFDEEGRPLNADPNSITSHIYIGDKKYKIQKCEWHVSIFDERHQLGEVDLTPDYIEKPVPPEWKEWYRDGMNIIDPNKNRVGTYVSDNDNQFYIIWSWQTKAEPAIITMPFIMDNSPTPTIITNDCDLTRYGNKEI